MGYKETLFDSIETLKRGLHYYIQYASDLEKETEYYQTAYANRVEEYLKLQNRIKSKIEELENKIKYEQSEKVLIQLYKQIKVLKELLEGSEENHRE